MARALAATGAHLESAALGQIQMPYRIALEKLFGFSNWESGHAQVKEWASLIAQSRATEHTT
jgi:hypothetical protein